MHPCGSLEVHQTPKSHNALSGVFKFVRYVQINTGITFTSSLRFLYIFDQSGLLCTAAIVLNEFIADWKAAQNVSGEHRGWLQLSEQNGELGEVATENNDSSVALGSP